jgi:uncharacterized protein YdeI (BOF family)
MKKLLVSVMLVGVATSAMAGSSKMTEMQTKVQTKFQQVQPQLATAASAKVSTLPPSKQAEVKMMYKQYQNK